jgi:hypothetical protein
MASTTNYNWSTPDDTALVKDGAAAIRTLGSSIDTTTKALNPSTTLGDIEYRSATANTNTRLGIGSDGQVLTVSSGVPAWAAAASASGPAFRAFRNTSQQSFSQNVATKVQLNAETFDTDNCFDSTTNYRFTPNKSGYYQMAANLQFSGANASTTKEVYIYKNGSPAATLGSSAGSGTPGAAANMGSSTLIYFNGTTDYAELYVYDSDAAARNVLNGSDYTYFTGVWIRS